MNDELEQKREQTKRIEALCLAIGTMAIPIETGIMASPETSVDRVALGQRRRLISLLESELGYAQILAEPTEN